FPQSLFTLHKLSDRNGNILLMFPTLLILPQTFLHRALGWPEFLRGKTPTLILLTIDIPHAMYASTHTAVIWFCGLRWELPIANEHLHMVAFGGVETGGEDDRGVLLRGGKRNRLECVDGRFGH